MWILKTSFLKKMNFCFARDGTFFSDFQTLCIVYVKNFRHISKNFRIIFYRSFVYFNISPVYFIIYLNCLFSGAIWGMIIGGAIFLAFVCYMIKRGWHNRRRNRGYEEI